MNAHHSGVRSFLGFMDHSITEQLLGQPDAWHTTAVVLAESAECGVLAKNIGSRVNRSTGRLRKWSRAGDGYRTTFAQALPAMLTGSGVFIVASSARERTILANRDLIVRELGLVGSIHEDVTSTGTARMKIGPFTDSSTGADHFFDSSTNRALMTFWIAHFVARAHEQMAASL